MMTAHSNIRRLQKPSAARHMPVGVYWLAALAVSLSMWAVLVRGVFWLLAV